MINHKHQQSGFGAIGFVIIAVVLIAVAGIGVIIVKHKSKSASSTTTSPSATPPATTTPPETVPPAQTMQHEEMTQYTNDKYGFSFYYAKDWQIQDGEPFFTYLEPDTIKLNLVLVDSKTDKTPAVAAVAVSTKKLADVGPDGGDGDMSQYKQPLTIKGKEVIKYTIPQTKTVNREIYYVGVGARTIWFQTVNEISNVERDPSYMSKFNELIDSIQLQ